MIQQQMIEIIQQLHPEYGETQIRLMLNQAMDEYVERCGISIEDSDTFNTDSSTMYFDFSTYLGSISDDDELLEITRVDYDDEPINRLVGADGLEGT
jgi:hypothetical protein